MAIKSTRMRAKENFTPNKAFLGMNRPTRFLPMAPKKLTLEVAEEDEYKEVALDFMNML